MSVALGIGGALFGAAIAARAAQLHAEEVRRLDRAMASNLEDLRSTEKGLAALKASPASHSQKVQEAIDKAVDRRMYLNEEKRVLEKKRARMGLDE
ncbi:hypothetical protein [Luteibacter yeojuensis]